MADNTAPPPELPGAPLPRELAAGFLESAARLVRLGELSAAREAVAQAMAVLNRAPRARGGR